MSDFLRLEDEVERIAGFHSGLTGHVSAESVGDPSIRLHEEIHDQVFCETADGLLHLLLLRWARNLGSVDQTSKRITEVGCRLLRQSRYAHECAATYIGILALPDAGARDRARDRLNAEYRRYYGAFAKALDPWFAAADIRYALAWGFTVWSFGSDRIARLAKLEDLEAPTFWAEPGPDARLRRLLAALDTHEIDKLRERVCLVVPGAHDARAEDRNESAGVDASSVSTEAALKDSAIACAVDLTGWPCLTKVPIPEFLRVASRGFDTRFYDGDEIAGRLPGEVPLRIAKHLARQADRWRIARPDLLDAGLPAISQLEATVVGWPSGERADCYVITRKRDGRPSHVVWCTRYPAEDNDGNFEPPCEASDTSLAPFIERLIRQKTLWRLFLVFLLEDCDNVDDPPKGFMALQEVFERDGDVGVIRPFDLTGALTPDPAPYAVFLLPYARASFSHVLASTQGKLTMFQADLREEGATSTSPYCAFLENDKVGIMQTFCLLTDRDLGYYRSLLAHRIEAKKLTVASPPIVNAATRRLLGCMWWSMPNL